MSNPLCRHCRTPMNRLGETWGEALDGSPGCSPTGAVGSGTGPHAFSLPCLDCGVLVNHQGGGAWGNGLRSDCTHRVAPFGQDL